jgi:predicted RNA-binding Zn-ribbon protein involved in translation (DUF1610 family)
MDKEKICKSIGLDIYVENRCPKCGAYSKKLKDKFLEQIACSAGEWYGKFKCTKCKVVFYVECQNYHETIKYKPPNVIEIPISELEPVSDLFK